MKLSISSILLSLCLSVACTKHTLGNCKNHGRAVTAFTLDEGQLGESKVSQDSDSSKIIVSIEEGVDLSV